MKPTVVLLSLMIAFYGSYGQAKPAGNRPTPPKAKVNKKQVEQRSDPSPVKPKPTNTPIPISDKKR
ncbi:MAG: hypothetical protein EBX41_04020 [Chitinophagia bacterium]|nr:hypothetical protein [Chitinophagia bacterium]